MGISLCIVARNEAPFVRACIESAASIVDEVVLVDTGSTDATVEIARATGARVFREPWPGDLGKAHDLPLRHARGDWILSLDGDEVLDPSACHDLPRLTGRGRKDGYVFTIRNYLYAPNAKWRRCDSLDPLVKGALGYCPNQAVRLYRRRPEFCYTGTVHQTIAPSITAAGGKIGRTEVPIHHYGHIRFDRAKSAFYGALARAQVAREPLSARAWIDLGIVLLEDIQTPRPAAAAAFRQARSLGLRATASYFLGRALLEMEQPAAAIPLLHEAVAKNRRDNSIFFDQADAYELLGMALTQAGRLPSARKAYRQALELRPDSPIARNNLADLLSVMGATSAADRMARQLVQEYRGLAMAWATLGTTQLRAGHLRDARGALATALQMDPENLPAQVNLAVALERAGCWRQARKALGVTRRQLDSPDAVGRNLREHLPPEAVEAPLALSPLGPGGVVSLIAHLAGGGGRVLVDGVHALRGKPQAVLCGHTGTYTGQKLEAELAALGVPVHTVNSESTLHAMLARLQPTSVLHHWWARGAFQRALRVGEERWIAIGHAALPMPFGYDAYVTGSSYHEQFQHHLPAARRFRIPNGVNLQKFAGTARRRRNKPVVAMLSRLDTGKFPRRLLDFLSPLADLDFRVRIAGFGLRQFEIEPEISARGLASVVRFLGPISTQAVPRFLRESDIGLHLTETHEEICSLTILEMLASGLPIVAEPKGCLPEMIVHGENGFLAWETDEISHHLRQLITSPALRRRMGKASRATARGYSFGRFQNSLRRLLRTKTRLGFSGVAAAGAVPQEWRPNISYLICSTPRCGSSLLCEALTNTGLAGWPGEFFIRRAPCWVLERWGETTDFLQYLGWLFWERSTPNGVFGAKVMQPHFRQLCQDVVAGQTRGHGRTPLHAVFPGLRYVRITRRNKLRQAISRLRADQTGQWWKRKDDPNLRLAQPLFDRGAIEYRLAELELDERRWQEFFDSAGVQPIEVVYEDLVKDSAATARRILRELGLKVPARLPLGSPTLARQSDSVTDEWVRRYREG